MAQKSRQRIEPHLQGQGTFQSPLSALALYRRDVILEAVAKSAQELLRAGNVTDSIPTILERIGTVANVERVHLLMVDTMAVPDNPPVVGHSCWTAPGVPAPIPDERIKNGSLASLGLKSFQTKLAAGQTITGHCRSFDAPARAFFESAGIKSTVAVPVFVDGHWWGFLAFDSCAAEREWLPSEVDTLKIIAELIGTALTGAQRQQRLADANHIIETSPTVVYRLGAQPPYPLTFISQNIQRYGYNAETLMSQPRLWPAILQEDDAAAALDHLNAIAEGRSDHRHQELRLKTPDGAYVWFAGESHALHDSAGRLIAIEGILTNITERKSVSETLAQLARTDPLTGLPNRAAFLDRLELAFTRGERNANKFCLFYLDLDHFKDVNDTLGHPAGDVLLKQVASRLTDCVRKSDVVARFGGDEFAILQEDVTGIESVEALAEKIGKALSQPFTIDGNQVHTTASIGIVPNKADMDGPAAMMMKADLALYRAKEDGRNKFRFHVDELDQEVRKRMVVSNDMHRAIERNEFQLFYQTQVELSSGAVTGTEALIRWNHPARGLVLPGEFIPVAESNGMILAIGEWVIEEACRQLHQWKKAGIRPPIMAVNISAAQFQLGSELDRIVAAAIEKYGITPDDLELELTESVLLETTERHRAAFERLRQIGVRLSIDDFGTGFSSLDYLRSFHVARLKLADRFIREINTSADAAAIVRASVGLASALGIEVVAEGVNSLAQRDFLLSVGCRYAQGFAFSEPMPADHMAVLLNQSTASHLHRLI